MLVFGHHCPWVSVGPTRALLAGASFRDLKSDGWQWQASRIWTPAYANRSVVMSIAYAWTLTLGHSRSVHRSASV